MLSYAIFDPTELGFPNSRERFYSSAVNRRTHVWLGPPPGDVREDFLSLMGRECCADGDVFVADTQENRDILESELRALVKPESSHECPEAFYGLFSGVKAKHLHKYKELMEKRGNCQDAFIADISQNPDARNRSASHVPSVSRSTCFVSLSRKLVFADKKVDASLGWPGLVTHS